MIGALITLIIYLIILGLLFLLVQYLLQLFPLPDPFGRVIQALIIIVGVLVVIGLLLDLGGYPVGFPRLRGYP